MARVRSVYKDGGAPNQLWMMRRTNELLYTYDVVASFGFLSEADHQEFKKHAIATAKKAIGDDPARFPSKKAPNPWGREWKTGYATNNRWTDQFIVGALVGMSFPDHPLAEAWVDYAIEQTRYQLDNGVWDGAWNEVPRYHDWTVLLYGGLFKSLKRRTGVDFFQDQKVKQLLDWYVRFSSSLVSFPETSKHNLAGEPTPPVWGDSNYGRLPFAACAFYAPQYAETDPDFSKRLMWMWRRAGSPMRSGWHFNLAFPMLADPRLPDEPQVLGSALCRKPGYVLLRSGFNTPDETVVYMRGGQRGGWHPRSDLGSVDLFSRGIPLALGSQAGPYSDPVGIEWNRSQQSNNVVVFGDKSRDRRESSGTILAWRSTPQTDYVVADCSRSGKDDSSFSWRRHLLLVKEPDYLVIWDEIASSLPSEYYLHTTAESLEWEDHRIVSHTAYNADLDVLVLLPSDKLLPKEKEGRFGCWLDDNPKKKSDPYPFWRLKYLILPAKPDGDFLTILHPKKPDGPTIDATLLSSSQQKVLFRVELDSNADLIDLGPEGVGFKRIDAPGLSLPMGVDGNVEPGALFFTALPVQGGSAL